MCIRDRQRTMLAPLHQRFELGAVENVMRRGGAADGDVNLLKLIGPLLERHGASAEFAAREQGARGFLAGLASTDDENFVFGERTENFLGEFHSGGHHGDAAAL